MHNTADKAFGTAVTEQVTLHLTPPLLDAAFARLHRKALVIVTWYAASYLAMVLAGGWLLGLAACTSLALSMAAVGFNIQHDANHNAFFDPGGRKRLSTANSLAGLSIHAIGASRKRWLSGHVQQHHAAPNVVGRDGDVDLAFFARLAPSQRHHRWHAFQHLYLWLVYAFTAASIILGDVVGTVQESLRGDRHGRPPTLGDWVVLLGSKGLFVAAFLIPPLLLHPWWVVAAGALYVLGLTGWLLGVVFQLAHVVSEADFCDAASRPDLRWHEWQVRASVDFCHGDGPVARAFTWYAGGLNFQTEHHLFPSLPHTVYPEIAPVVAEVCGWYAIPYQVQPTLRAAVRSHYRHVREMGAGARRELPPLDAELPRG